MDRCVILSYVMDLSNAVAVAELSVRVNGKSSSPDSVAKKDSPRHVTAQLRGLEAIELRGR